VSHPPPANEHGTPPSHSHTDAILGLSYVGLTLSTVLAQVGFPVVGIDRDEALIADLRQGKPHFYEKGLEQMLARIERRPWPPQCQVALKAPCAEICIVTVGTPIKRPSLEPNLDYANGGRAPLW
jgi:UDP-N-acetyl-D-mannosaminuronic acid dehydrogenase